MTTLEFLSLIQSKGAKVTPPSKDVAISILNTSLQQSRISVLPSFLTDLYKYTSGIFLGSAYIFGPTEFDRGIKHPLPCILDINKEIVGIQNLFGKIVFGRNDLFWFAADALGNCYMLDNLSLSVLRKYDDPYRAMLDCLIVGKI